MACSQANYYAFRLYPGDDLKSSIESFAKLHNLQAGSMVTGMGSLKHLNIRLATNTATKQTSVLEINDNYELLSLSGTFAYHSIDGSDVYDTHLHVAVADINGISFGGHLLYNNIVQTTAEIVVMNLPSLIFRREIDELTGYKELVVALPPKEK
jgi:predicted DNA-binding protein with PD1-like motif